MRFFTADRAKRKFGALLKAADDDFVEIRKHGRRAYVLMPTRLFDLYEQMRRSYDEISVLLTAESAVAKFLDDQGAQGEKILGKASALLRSIVDPRRR